MLDQIVNVTDHNDYEIVYTYRADGQKKTIKVKKPNDQFIYDIKYTYDRAARLQTVSEPIIPGTNDRIATFDYDDNGNRKRLTYSLDGTPDDNSVYIDYTYKFQVQNRYRVRKLFYYYISQR